MSPPRATDHDRRCDAGKRADVALPDREPVEGLERRAVGAPLELPPLMLDGREIGVHRQRDPGRGPRLLGDNRRAGRRVCALLHEGRARMNDVRCLCQVRRQVL